MLKLFKHSAFSFFLFIGFFLPIKLVSQQYNFKNYSVENGLPYIQIFSMFQDSKGYLWSGGYGGLSKFNGKTFKNYSPKNGLANHFVNAIIEDQFHLITVGTIDGLSVIDKVKGKISNYYVEDGLPSNNVTCFCLDPRIGLWTGTNKGLCIWDGKKVIQVPYFKNLNITGLIYTTNFGVLIGTNKGLYKQTETGFETVLDSVNVTSISQYLNSSTIFAGTNNGLYQIDLQDKKTTVFHINNGLIDENINTVLCQKNGTIWIGSKSGLISFNGKEFSYYTIGYDNNSNHIRSLLIDYEDNLWIGTHNGLYRYRGKVFTLYDKQDGLGGAFIFQITKDKNQDLWFGTESNGAFKFSNGYFKNYSIKEGMLDNKVSAIMNMDDGSIWFGTDKGISILKGDRFEHLTQGTSFMQKPPINCFYRDSKDRIWIGGKNGITCMEKIGKKYIPTYYKLPAKAVDKDGYDVWTIIEDIDGTIWAGTYLVGIYKLENNQFKPQAFPNTSITSGFDFCKDNYGNIYAATLNGVLMFNPRKHSYKLISEKEGLSSELVYALGITKDKKYLWAGTNQGINRIDLKKLQYDIIDIVSYGKADGFSGVELNTHGIFEDSDSSIWFGTVNGLIKYSPKEFIENDNQTKTNISAIKISYIDTFLTSGSTLPFALNNISFDFDGICLTNPEKVLYTYKLEGFDNDWSPYSESNNAKYDNLPAGKYTFKVKSCNNEGIWNIEPTTFSFRIEPPFYKTWWFIVSCLLLSIGLLITIFRIRLFQIKQKQKAEFEQQVEISKAELKALRAQMNPHFVFNSLNSIQHYILNSKGGEAVKYLSKFAKLIRLILNNSEKPSVTINEDLEAITLYLELERMRFDNKFSYDISIDSNLDPDFEEIPPMLIQPYLENAILHGINPKEGQGHIKINIQLIDQFIKISIIDDGIGREKSEAVQSIRSRSPHKSLGMKITKDRLKILNAIHQSHLSVNVIDLYSERKESSGTQVDIYIPYIK